MELLSWKSVKELTADGGVIKTIVAEGTGWETAKAIDGATISYVVRAPGADAILASAESVELPRVSDAPCAGLVKALCAMKAGERARVLLKAVPEGVDYVAGLLPAGAADADVELTLGAIHKVEVISGTAEGVTK